MKTFKEITGESVSSEEWAAFWKVFGIVSFGAMLAGLFMCFIIATIKLLFQIF